MEQILKSKIISGEFNPGEQIPTENDLCKTYQVSSVTVKKAILNLVNEELLTRTQGKGTFVTDKISKMAALQHDGTISNFIPGGIEEQKVEVIDIINIKAPTKVARLLQIDEAEEIVRVRRTRSINDIPISHIVNYLPLEIGQKIKKEDLCVYPMLQILREKLRIQLIGGFQEIEAMVADQDIAAALSVSICSPILYLEVLILGREKKPIEFVQTYNRADQVKFSLRLDLKTTNNSESVNKIRLARKT